MEPPSMATRLRAVAPVAAVAGLALVAVFVAMTALGSAGPDATASPPGSVVAAATPTASSSVAEATPSGSGTVAAGSRTPGTTGLPPTVTSATGSAKDAGGIWQVSYHYPRLAAPAIPTVAAVNEDITNDIEARLQAFEAGPAAIEQQPGKVNTLIGSYKVQLLRSDLASFVFTWVDDTSGAHPATTIETLSYDLSSGARIAYADVFTDSQAAGAILSQQSRDLLRAVLGTDYDPTIVNDGTSPDCPSLAGPTPSCPLAAGSNFATWALDPKGLVVIFQEYQVAAYADGTPSVVVPWSALAGVLKPDGPAAPLAGS